MAEVNQKVLKPSPGRVVVKRLEKVKQIGRILLPDNAQKKHNKGIIVAVGEPKKDEVPWLKTGMEIIFNDYGFGHVPDDETLAIVGYNDILCEVSDA